MSSTTSKPKRKLSGGEQASDRIPPPPPSSQSINRLNPSSSVPSIVIPTPNLAATPVTAPAEPLLWITGKVRVTAVTYSNWTNLYSPEVGVSEEIQERIKQRKLNYDKDIKVFKSFLSDLSVVYKKKNFITTTVFEAKIKTIHATLIHRHLKQRRRIDPNSGFTQFNSSYAPHLYKAVGNVSVVKVRQLPEESNLKFLEGTLVEKALASAIADLCAVVTRFEYVEQTSTRSWIFAGIPFDTSVAATIFAISLDKLQASAGVFGPTTISNIRGFIQKVLFKLEDLDCPHASDGNASYFIQDKVERFQASFRTLATLFPSTTSTAPNSVPTIAPPVSTRPSPPSQTNQHPRIINSTTNTSSSNLTALLPPSNIKTPTTTIKAVKTLPPSLSNLTIPLTTIAFDPEEDQYLTSNKFIKKNGILKWLEDGSNKLEECSVVDMNEDSLRSRVMDKTISDILYLDTSADTPVIRSVISRDTNVGVLEIDRLIEQTGTNGDGETLTDTFLSIMAISGKMISMCYLCPEHFISTFCKSDFAIDYWIRPDAEILFVLPRKIAEEAVSSLELATRMIQEKLKANGIIDWERPRISTLVVQVPFPAAHHTKEVIGMHRTKKCLNILASSGNASMYGYAWKMFVSRQPSPKVSVESSMLLHVPMNSNFGRSALQALQIRLDSMISDNQFLLPCWNSIRHPVYTKELKAMEKAQFQAMLNKATKRIDSPEEIKAMTLVDVSAAARLEKVKSTSKLLKPTFTLNPLALTARDIEVKLASDVLNSTINECPAGTVVIVFCFNCRSYSTNPRNVRDRPEQSSASSKVSVSHPDKDNRSGNCGYEPNIGWSCAVVSMEDFEADPEKYLDRFTDYKNSIETYAVAELLPLSATSLWYVFYESLIESHAGEIIGITVFVQLARSWYHLNRYALRDHPELPAFWFAVVSDLSKGARIVRGSFFCHLFGPGYCFLSVNDRRGEDPTATEVGVKIEWTSLLEYLMKVDAKEIRKGRRAAKDGSNVEAEGEPETDVDGSSSMDDSEMIDSMPEESRLD